MARSRKRIIWIFVLLMLLGAIGSSYYYRYTLRYYAVSVYYYIKDSGSNGGLHQTSPAEMTIPLSYSVYGIDVSHYQQKIDWDEILKVRINDRPVEFVFIKASEGSQWKDPYYKRNYRKARKKGIIVGAYHYYQPKVHSDKQLNNFASMVRLEKGDLAPVLDVEEIQDMPKERFQLGVKTLLEKFERQYGMLPILYTNQDFYFKYFAGKDFEKYPIWIAYFSFRKPGLSESKWTFWQFSDKGRMSGIPERVDLNAFKGSMEDLELYRKK